MTNTANPITPAIPAGRRRPDRAAHAAAAGRWPCRPSVWPRSPWPPADRRPRPRPPRPPRLRRRRTGGGGAGAAPAEPARRSGTIAAITGTSLEVQNPTTGPDHGHLHPDHHLRPDRHGDGGRRDRGLVHLGVRQAHLASSSAPAGLRRPGDGDDRDHLPADLGQLHRRLRRRGRRRRRGPARRRRRWVRPAAGDRRARPGWRRGRFRRAVRRRHRDSVTAVNGSTVTVSETNPHDQEDLERGGHPDLLHHLHRAARRRPPPIWPWASAPRPSARPTPPER